MKKKILSNLFKFICLLCSLIFLIWAYQSGNFQLIFDYPDEFIVLFSEHLKLVTLSSALAIFTSIPVGIFITRERFKKFEWAFLNLANIGQAVPSIAVLALIMLVLGIGLYSAVIALFMYSLLPILRNTVEGIKSIDNQLLDSAKGMGLTPTQILFRIEIPNALPTMMGGIRTAVVLNIGNAALAYLIGGGGLGDYIFTGIEMLDSTYLLSGAVPVTLMAIIADSSLRLIERFITSKGVRLRQSAIN
ncbi:ABC transporter permease [Aeribacillus pallidus]|jgi:osmoprotectant transport system permease protein|uniref:ABC transporter permease n=1 Tax=Aeribacillus pallidus TaxID=33936 RepID=UPI003D1AC2C2